MHLFVHPPTIDDFSSPVGLAWFQHCNLLLILHILLPLFILGFPVLENSTWKILCRVPDICLNSSPCESEVLSRESSRRLRFSLSKAECRTAFFQISLYCLISVELLSFLGSHLGFWSIFLSSSLWELALSYLLEFNFSKLSLLSLVLLFFPTSEKLFQGLKILGEIRFTYLETK